jgi:hypothetical protein
MVLIKVLVKRSKVIHAGNKSELLKHLIKYSENSVGVIDEDPYSVQPPLMNMFKQHAAFTNYGIKILTQENKRNVLVILMPRLEEWVIESAKEVRVDLNEYGLPKEPILFHEIVNTKLDNFKKLVEYLVKTKSSRIVALKNYLLRKQ